MRRWLPLALLILVGAVSRDQIRRQVDADQPLLQLCYESVLSVRPELEGQAVVRFEIGRDGRVAAVSVSGPASHPALTGCVTDLVRQWHFGPQEQTTTVELPLRFRPKPVPARAQAGEPMSAHTVLLLMALMAVALIVLLVRIASTGDADPDRHDKTGE